MELRIKWVVPSVLCSVYDERFEVNVPNLGTEKIGSIQLGTKNCKIRVPSEGTDVKYSKKVECV